MYTVTSSDRPRELVSLPQSDVGAPCPMLIADRHTLLLVYYIQANHLAPSWLNIPIQQSISADTVSICGIVRFRRPYAHIFGPPNDEAFSGHPLAGRGLCPYAAFEVEGSSWVRTLEKMNSVHPYHNPERFALYKHFIFAFHDETFECVAEAFDFSLCRGDVRSVLRHAESKA